MPHRLLPGSCLVLTVLLGIGSVSTSRADKLHTFHYGVGPAILFINSSYPAIGPQAVAGMLLGSSTRVGDDLYVDSGTVFSHIHTGTTSNVVYPPDTAMYLAIWGTVRKNLWPTAKRKWTPWVALGFNLSDIGWDNHDYHIVGFGYSVKFGADWKLGPVWRLRAQIGQHGFSSRDNYGFGPYATDLREISVSLMYRLPIH